MVEQRAAGQGLGGIGLFVHPARPRAGAHELHQGALVALMLKPQYLVGDRGDLRPDGLVVLADAPIGAQVAVVQRAELGVDPRRQVHAVGHV